MLAPHLLSAPPSAPAHNQAEACKPAGKQQTLQDYFSCTVLISCTMLSCRSGRHTPCGSMRHARSSLQLCSLLPKMMVECSHLQAQAAPSLDAVSQSESKLASADDAHVCTQSRAMPTLVLQSLSRHTQLCQDPSCSPPTGTSCKQLRSWLCQQSPYTPRTGTAGRHGRAHLISSISHADVLLAPLLPAQTSPTPLLAVCHGLVPIRLLSFALQGCLLLLSLHTQLANHPMRRWKSDWLHVAAAALIQAANRSFLASTASYCILVR